MTDKDTITLPREVVEQLLKMLEMVEPYADQLTDYSSTAAEWPLNLLPEKVGVAITALRTHLAAEQPKPEPVAWRPRLSPNLCFHWSRPWSPGVPSEQTVDYWNQKGAGVEYAYAAPPALAAEPTKPSDDVEALRRDAERYRWLRDKAPPDIGDMASVRDSHDPSEIDAAIDAAMKEDKT